MVRVQRPRPALDRRGFFRSVIRRSCSRMRRSVAVRVSAGVFTTDTAGSCGHVPRCQCAILAKPNGLVRPPARLPGADAPRRTRLPAARTADGTSAVRASPTDDGRLSHASQRQPRSCHRPAARSAPGHSAHDHGRRRRFGLAGGVRPIGGQDEGDSIHGHGAISWGYSAGSAPVVVVDVVVDVDFFLACSCSAIWSQISAKSSHILRSVPRVLRAPARHWTAWSSAR